MFGDRIDRRSALKAAAATATALMMGGARERPDR